MKKVYLEVDEWYPVYTFITEEAKSHFPSLYNSEVEVDDKTYKKWVRAFKQFHIVQDEIKGFVETLDKNAYK